MKKIIATYSILILLISFNNCKSSGNDNKSSSDTNNNTGDTYTIITSPLEGAVFQTSNTISVTVEAVDPDGVKAVRLWIDGVFHSLDNNLDDSIFNFTVNGLTPGTHTLMARARDVGDETTDSPKITITVEDGSTGNARWTFLVFMNGDNNLESLVTLDLNELEIAGSGDDVHVVVQADRIPGYSTDDGNWTGTRRYYITKDNNENNVSSVVLEDLGELDMGDPAVLSDFLLWAHANYPADNIFLSLWNHGDSWRSSSRTPDSRTISDDETSGSTINIARDELIQGLQAIVAARGPIEVIGFDACNMASWEVAHSLKGYADYMAGSETYVYSEGFLYDEAIKMLRSNPAATGADLADMLARDAVQTGNESTESAIDINALDDLTAAVDNLAELVLNDTALKNELLNARTRTRTIDPSWKNWYLDLNDLGDELTNSSNSDLRNAGQAIKNGISTAVISAYGSSGYEWTGGLTIMFDFETSPAYYLSEYERGTWAAATEWDDLLYWLYQN